MIFVLSARNAEPSAPDGNRAAILSELESVILNEDFDELYEYIRLPLWAALISSTWNDPNDIRPNAYVNFFAYYDAETGNKWNGKFPADELEGYVQTHFDVSTEHLRLSDKYDADNNIYVHGGLGSAGPAVITDAWLEDEVLFIAFHAVSRANDEDITWSGETQIAFSDNGYKFIASKRMPDMTIPAGGPYIDGAPIDLNNLDLVKRVYVRPLIPCGPVLGYDWDTPADIKADDLIDICAYNNFLNLPVEPINATISGGAGYVDPHAPAEQVEPAIQKHFSVSSVYLRTSESYDAKTNTYSMLSGWGGGWGYFAISAAKSGDQIIIEVGATFDQGPIIPTGTLTIEIDQNNRVHYLSHKLK